MSFVQLKDKNGSAIVPNAPLPIVEIQGSSGAINLESGYIYQAGQLSSVTITLVSPSDPDYDAEYFLSFESGSTPTTITWPSGLVFANSATPPTIVDNAHYEISIRNNLCIVQVFGVNTGGGGGGGSVTFDEVGSYTPKFGRLRDNGNPIFPQTLKPIIYVPGTTPSITADDGYVYICEDEITSLDFTLTPSSVSDYNTEYEIRFRTGTTPVAINWPGGLTFENRPAISPDSYTIIKITDTNVRCTSYADIASFNVGTSARVSFDVLTEEQIQDIVDNA